MKLIFGEIPHKAVWYMRLPYYNKVKRTTVKKYYPSSKPMNIHVSNVRKRSAPQKLI